MPDENGYAEVGDRIGIDLDPVTMKRKVAHPLIEMNMRQAQAALDRESNITPEQRREGRAKIQRQIEEGYVDLGPMADHSAPVIDIRDNRDPEAYFLQLRRMRDTRSDCRTLKDAQEIAQNIGLNTPEIQTTFINHAAEHRRDYERRAAEGDKHAAAILKGESLAEDPVD